MVSSDGRYVVVFNGEIYNHLNVRQRLSPPAPWRSSADTETLLESYRQWGVRCLEHLNGMFAFAIWDSMERKLFLARDRMGVKPLYYSWYHGTFAFASRPRALVPLLNPAASEIDPEALRMYSELGYIPAPLSFYTGVRKLRPGHFLVVDARGARETCYWDYRQIAPDPTLLGRSEEALADELDGLIREATRDRLISDVPVGAFLSGGVDSAYIVAAMKASGVSAPNAFTIAFAEPQYDESAAAAAIARHIGVEHVTETLSVSDLLQLLPLYVEEVDEPFADSSAFPTMAVARLARQHVTVALTGDAGDELFGGYHYYHLLTQLKRVSEWPLFARRGLRLALRLLPLHRAKLLAGALGPDTVAGIFNYMRTLSKDFGPLVSETILNQTESSRSRFEHTAAGFAAGLSSAEVGMRLDMAYTLVDGYLQKVDVATMAMSLEARCPLIDYRLVEWSMRLPVSFKLRRTHTKYLLKKALCRYLPQKLIYRPKRGFAVPTAAWLRGPLRGWAQELLHDESVLSRIPLDRKRIHELFKLHTSGARDAHPVLWGVLMLLCYVARHDRGQVLPPVITKRAA
jgi:asparagine synthase (glutamine-hydrolysing)